MNKSKGGLKAGYVLIASVLLLVFGAYCVGRNASTAQQLAGDILAQDNAGQAHADSEQKLADFVHHHMGSSTSLFLSTSYNQAVQGAAASSSSGGQIYHQAQAACVSHTTAVVQAKCVQDYVNAHATASTPAPTVDKQPYSLSYTSPKWTPDLAGLILLLGGLGLLTGIGLWLRGRI